MRKPKDKAALGEAPSVATEQELEDEGLQFGDANEPKFYSVAEGKSFRDKDNFDKVYEEGDDVSNFDQQRLDRLLSIGYIQED